MARNTATAEAEAPTLEFIDELPSVRRSQESGVWSQRVAALQSSPGKWASIHQTEDGKSPHPTVHMLKAGKAAGVDPTQYEFVGRVIDGVGHVYGRFLTDEQRAERDANAESNGSGE